MDLCPLEKVKHKVVPGTALPFSLRDQSGRLLLAKGQLLSSAEQLEDLLERGAWVLMDELAGPRQALFQAPAELLPGLWRRTSEQLARALRPEAAAELDSALDSLARDLAALLSRSADLALFLIVQRDRSEHVTQAVGRAHHAGVCALLIGQRMNWSQERLLRFVKAAFTMNLGQMALYDRFANQREPITEAQRKLVRQHPDASLAALQRAGIADTEWLNAVVQHHERPGGSGYPQGLTEVSEMGVALGLLDVFGALLSTRASRPSMPPNMALKQLLQMDRNSPAALALVKEFGVFPPGTLVKLSSGETAIVVLRSPDPQAPRVMVLSSRHGDILPSPYPRDTTAATHRVAGILAGHEWRGAISASKLYAKLVA